MKYLETRIDLISKWKKNLKIAELGVFKGEFSKEIYRICKPSELFLVDLFEDTNHSSRDKDGKNTQIANLRHEFTILQNYFRHDKRVKVIKNTTKGFLQGFKGYLDAVYIDACHSYECVRDDLFYSYELIKTKGGIIAGHDYMHDLNCTWSGVKKAVDEFCKQRNLRINYLTNDGCPSFEINLTRLKLN